MTESIVESLNVKKSQCVEIRQWKKAAFVSGPLFRGLDILQGKSLMWIFSPCDYKDRDERLLRARIDLNVLARKDAILERNGSFFPEIGSLSYGVLISGEERTKSSVSEI